MPRVLPALACLVVLSAASCTGDGDDDTPPAAEPTVVATPLGELDLTTMTVPRAAFCAAVPQAAVEDALGGPAASTEDYGNGDPLEVREGLTDVAHEFGCVFTAADGAQARAWVFVPPLTRERAGQLVRQLGREKGCRVIAQAPAFGSPSLARVCEGSASGAPTEASYRGLFGDAWLTCSVSADGTADALLERADVWCANVVTAAAAG
ncbi:hypothetical protein [Nocardioides pacificus]